MAGLYEIFLSGGEQTADDNLVWKEVLVEGESAYTPTPAGPVRKPFKVINEGESDLPNGIVSMEELEKNFDGAFENVQVILGQKPLTRKPDGTIVGGDHEDITFNNTGFVRALKRSARKDGTKRLMAGIEFTEPDIKDKCLRGTYANCSAGILGGVVNKHTGGEFRAAMKHLAITNSPWRGGMQKFGEAIDLSDDVDGEIKVISFKLDDPFADDDITGEVVWEDSDTSEWVRQRVQNALTELTKSTPGVGDDTYFYVSNVARTSNKALVVQEGGNGGGDSFVVPFEVSGEDVALAPGARWTKTKQVMVAAADELADDHLKQRIQNALGYQLRLGDDYVVESVGKEEAVVKNTVLNTTFHVGWDLSDNKIWLDPLAEWRRSESEVEPRAPKEEKVKTDLSDEIDTSTPEGRLAAARRSRGLLDNGNYRGGQKHMTSIKLDDLNLSDEQRAAIEAQLSDAQPSADEKAELERLRRAARENEVNTKIEGLQEMGLSDNPGLAKYLRRIYLSDDKQPVAVLLADEASGTGKQEVTLSQAFDGLFALLKNQETGKIELSSQATRGEAGKKPPVDTTEENKSVDEQLAEAADVLGLSVRERKTR